MTMAYLGMFMVCITPNLQMGALPGCLVTAALQQQRYGSLVSVGSEPGLPWAGAFLKVSMPPTATAPAGLFPACADPELAAQV
jgi:hypothetical protein